MLQIGPHTIATQTVLAPMAGVSDLPFRQLCAAHGAGMVVNEMVTSDTRLWPSIKSRTRLTWGTAAGPRVIQIAGSEPGQMALAAQEAAQMGAQIVDINMGCPAKKVCKKAAGSALLKDEPLVSAILEAVVGSVSIPVTLKTRTGWDTLNRNIFRVAKIAEESGIQALTVHGRTRACRFEGSAEYDTIGELVTRVHIPVIANGDIDSPDKAKIVLRTTGAAAVMIGRGAQGNPWLFGEINEYLVHGSIRRKPLLTEVYSTLLCHFDALYECYGELTGARLTRKHLNWYLQRQTTVAQQQTVKHLQQRFNAMTTAGEQRELIHRMFDHLQQLEDHAA